MHTYNSHSPYVNAPVCDDVTPEVSFSSSLLVRSCSNVVFDDIF